MSEKPYVHVYPESLFRWWVTFTPAGELAFLHERVYLRYGKKRAVRHGERLLREASGGTLHLSDKAPWAPGANSEKYAV
ncbi:hypothetical protein [Microbacterium sp. LWH11-1.2]|uniref:hypothetical protein n=1 Tax=Microbacterium sp. LWH11-1.2 TaxID=3135258 RepID=UPI00313A076E